MAFYEGVYRGNNGYCFCCATVVLATKVLIIFT